MKNLIALFCSVLLFTSSSFAQANVQESFNTSENTLVDFHLTYAKDIKVKAWDKDKVEILAKVILADKSTSEGFTINVHKDGNEYHVKSKLDYDKLPKFELKPDADGNINHDGQASFISYDNGTWTAVSHKITYEIKVPKYLAIDLCAAEANVEVKGINTPMNIKTKRGFIDVARSASEKADVKLSTTSGEIFTDFDIPYDRSSTNKHKRNHCQATEIEAAINGGNGDDISLSSTCGNIYLRKEK